MSESVAYRVAEIMRRQGHELLADELVAEIEQLRRAMEWAYHRAARIAEPAYVHPEGTTKAAESIVARLREALDA